jgi:hypothetical protein
LVNYHSSNSPKTLPGIQQDTKGHMKNKRQGVQSTRVLAKTIGITNVPALPKMKDIYIKIYNATQTMHSNQTDCFPATSSRGNKYIMVLVKVAGNYVNAEPMKNKSEGSMIPSAVEPTYCIRNSETKDKYNGKKHQRNTKRKYKKLHDLISPTRQPQKKSCRTSDTNLQTPLQDNPCGSRQHFSIATLG